MASFFGHAAVALTMGQLTGRRAPDRPRRGWPFWAAITACATAADLDVIGFWFGISYSSPWGHRGFTHSIAFGAVMAGTLAALTLHAPGKPWLTMAWLKRTALFWAVALTHPLLDMLTNGGLGVALWWPIKARRLFFPYRPIEVSPIGVGAFFSDRGIEVLTSEFYTILLPCAVALGIRWAVCTLRKRRAPSS